MSREKIVVSANSVTDASAFATSAVTQSRFFQPPSFEEHGSERDKNFANRLLKNTHILESTGIPDLDAFLNSESLSLSAAFGVKVDLVIIEDYTPNAFAINRSYSGKSHGAVLVGRKLVQQQIMAGRSGLYSLIGIMAHEWAHIVQYKLDLKQSVKERELHADYLAGWYLAQKGQMGNMVDYQTFASTLYSRGDYSFSDESHHGTPAERVNAMLAGVKDIMNSQTLSVNTAFDTGLSRVRSGYLS